IFRTLAAFAAARTQAFGSSSDQPCSSASMAHHSGRPARRLSRALPGWSCFPPPVWCRRPTRKAAMTPTKSSRLSASSSPPSSIACVSWRSATLAAFQLVLAWILVAPLPAAAAGAREDHPNLVGGELLGRGFAMTFNYERFLNNHFGLGGGLMGFG